MLLLSVSMSLTSCEGALDDILGEWSRPTPGSSTGGAVTSIGLDADEMKLAVGDKGQLNITDVAPADATDKTVTWSSDQEAIATVDENGLVTAVAAGTAIITATANDGSGVTATCTVTVLPKGALAGVFSVSDTKQVRFSKGNLQATYDGTKWTWAFAENQWDYIGKAAANTSINGNGTISGTGTVDLFGWVGGSSSFTGAAQYGINSSVTDSEYGNSNSDALKSDWGTLAISNGGNTANSGWRTLTSAEWTYLFNGRTSVTTRYCKATVNSMSGVVLFPDSYTHPEGVTDPASTNTADAAYTTNTWISDDWSKMETAGCVFLPAAGIRGMITVDNAGSKGHYCSSSSDDTNKAYYVSFLSDYLQPAYSTFRYFGGSVRLVRPVE